MRTIKIAALNIAMHKPHSAERYASLMRDAYALRRMVRQGALHGAMLGALYGDGNNLSPEEMSGEIYRFVNLDQSEPWFNTRTKEAASDADIEKIVIPDHLLPHLQRIPFIFRPQTHQLIFVRQDRQDGIGPGAAARFFSALFTEVWLDGNYPAIEVTPIADRENLEAMLSLASVDRVTIELKRPNADDAGSEQERWMKKLEKMNVQKQTTELVATKGSSIKPDKETRALAQVAADNGNVTVVGRDADGSRIEESTSNRPWVVAAKVDENIETTMQVLQRAESPL